MGRTTRLVFEVAVLVVKPSSNAPQEAPRHLPPKCVTPDFWSARRPCRWPLSHWSRRKPLKFTWDFERFLNTFVDTFVNTFVNSEDLWATN
jgi:hypothetical protein